MIMTTNKVTTMETTNDQTSRDVEEVTGSLVQNLRLDQSLCLESEVSSSGARNELKSTYGNSSGNGITDITDITDTISKQDIILSNEKIMNKKIMDMTRKSTATGSIASSGISSSRNSNATSLTANVVTNTNSSSGDERSNDKSESCFNTWTGEHGETTKLSAETKELLDQSLHSHAHDTCLGNNPHRRNTINHRRTPTHDASPVPQHDAHVQQRSLDGGFDSYPMKNMEQLSTAYATITSKLPKRKRTKSKNRNPVSADCLMNGSEVGQDSNGSGYDASDSSNDISGMSSPSVSSSDSSRPLCRSKIAKRKAKSYWAKADDTSFNSSSDLADFSSGVSSDSSKITPGPLSDYSEDLTAKNAPVMYFNSALKPADTFAATSFASAASKAIGTVLSSYPVRHRRRSTGRNTVRETSTHLKSFQVSKANSGAANPDAQKDTTVPPTYSFPDTWSFVERELKKKMKFEDILKKKTYEEHYKELNANFESAVKKVRYLDSGSSSSVKSSLSGTSCVKGCQITVAAPASSFDLSGTDTPIYDVGADVMAKILTYLKPIEVYSVVSMPLSKTFKMTFSNPQDLWKVLCLSAPFYAKVDKNRDNSDDSISSYPLCRNKNVEMKHLLGKYRLLYSSLIKCIRYLDRIKEDGRNGRKPAGVYVNEEEASFSYEDNDSLTNFFATAHQMKRKERDASDDSTSNCQQGTNDYSQKRHKSANVEKKKPKIKYGVSKLTSKLLGPQHAVGIAGDVGLPWSCAMYSVTNWMVAFADVAGIQLMCLKVLPDLLVDESQRTSAQHIGLTDVVLRAMVLFPHMVKLHTAAFHTLVLLARPLGGKEGMLFHSAMVKADGIFNIGSSTGKSGIAIMLDSMKRFVDDEDLQAMSCWSMVNIALIPSQKVVLVRLGGISSAANAMIHHPHNAEVQFRALFALINLVIPSENLDNSVEIHEINEQIAGMNQESEIEVLDDSIEQITNLVVVAMKNFCSSEAILNRACLVLHNLSLNAAYHKSLLLTPNCYQMLEWCIGNYRHDNVLQQSACGTLSRLQQTISNDRSLRHEFTESIRAQEQQAVQFARNDAAMLNPLVFLDADAN